MLKLGSGDHILEISVLIEENESLQSFENADLDISVFSGKFQGMTSAGVDADGMRRFCRELCALHKTLRGEAKLESMSPNELLLRVFAYNSRGGLAVEGSVGRHVYAENRLFWNSVSFGFEFQLSELESAVRQPWVLRYAG